MIKTLGLVAFISLSLSQPVLALGDKQTTEGNCSPAVNNTGGDVEIHCSGLTDQEVRFLLQKINEIPDLTLTIENQASTLNYLTRQLIEKDQNIVSLEEKIETFAKRTKEALSDPEISDDIKALIQVGDIAGAEILVDENYQLEEEDKKLAAKHYQRGKVKELAFKLYQAEKSLLKAAALQPENTIYLHAAGSISKDLGRYNVAFNLYQQALTSDLKTYGEDHPKVATRRNNLAVVYESLGRYEEAVVLYQQALASDLKTYGEDHPKVATDRNNLAINYYTQGLYQKSEEQMLLALKIWEKRLGKDHPNTKSSRKSLAIIQEKLALTER